VKTLTSVIATLRELADKEKHNPIHGVHSRLKKARRDLIEKEGALAKLDAHENSN
jgi:ribosomal protein L18E